MIQIPNILTDAAPWIIGGVSTVISFILGRRKTKADTIAIELANVEKAIDIYKTVSDDLRKELEQVKRELTKVHEQNKQLIGENKQLKQQMKDLERKLDTVNRKTQ